MKINKWVIGGVAFVVGGGIGVGVTYLIMKKRHKYEKEHYCDDCDLLCNRKKIEDAQKAFPQYDFERDYDQLVEKASRAIDESKKAYANMTDTCVETASILRPFTQDTKDISNNSKTSDLLSVVQSYASAVQAESTPTVPYISPEEDRAYMEFMAAKKRERAERMKKKFTRYDKIDKDFEDGMNIDDLKEVDEVQLKINNDQPEKPIHIITPEQFANECYGYSKNTLQWWKRNNLMTTEDYEIVDVPDLIGTEWVDRIGEFEPNVVYIRNDMSDSDYEIIATEENYYDFRN